MKGKAVLVILLIAMIAISGFLPIAEAATLKYTTSSGAKNPSDTDLSTKYCVLPNGKTVFAEILANSIKLQVYTVAGAMQYDKTFTAWSASDAIFDVMIFPFKTDGVGIAYYYDESGNTVRYMKVGLYNTTTDTSDMDELGSHYVSTGGNDASFTNVINVGTNYYFAYSTDCYGGFGVKITSAKVLSVVTLSYTADYICHNMKLVYNSTTGDDKAWIILSMESNHNAKVYQWDLGDMTVESLFNTGAVYIPQTVLGFGQIGMIRNHYDGTFTYLSISYCYPYTVSGLTAYKIVQLVAKFNGAISAANYLDIAVKQVTYMTTYNDNSFPYLFYEYDVGEYMLIYYMYSGLNEWYQQKLEVDSANLYDLTDLTIDTVSYSPLDEANIDFPTIETLYLGSCNIYRPLDGAMSFVNFFSDLNYVRAYTVSAIVTTYTFTFVAVPDTSPKITGVSYQFTVTILANGLAYTDGIEILWDGVHIAYTEPSAAGQVVYQRTDTVAGIHTLTINIVSTAGFVLDGDSQSYTYAQSTEPPTYDDTATAAGLNIVTQILIPLCLYGFGIGIFLSVMPNVMGLAVGVGVASGIGFVASVIPFYILIIMVILAILLMIFGRRD